MKLTRFACFIVKEERDWTPFNFLLIAIFLSLGFAILFGSSIGGMITVVISVVALASKLIYNWACKRFLACFCLSADTDEKNILEKLRELAVWLEEEFEKADETLDKEAAEWKIQRAKNRFWSMWRLTKAMGFPVFKSWKTHAKVKF